MNGNSSHILDIDLRIASEEILEWRKGYSAGNWTSNDISCSRIVLWNTQIHYKDLNFGKPVDLLVLSSRYMKQGQSARVFLLWKISIHRKSKTKTNCAPREKATLIHIAIGFHFSTILKFKKISFSQQNFLLLPKLLFSLSEVFTLLRFKFMYCKYIYD